MSQTTRKRTPRADLGPTYGIVSTHMLLQDVGTQQKYVANKFTTPRNFRQVVWHPVVSGSYEHKGYRTLKANMSKLRTSKTPMKGRHAYDIPGYKEKYLSEKRKGLDRLNKDLRKRNLTPKVKASIKQQIKRTNATIQRLTKLMTKKTTSKKPKTRKRKLGTPKTKTKARQKKRVTVQQRLNEFKKLLKR